MPGCALDPGHKPGVQTCAVLGLFPATYCFTFPIPCADSTQTFLFRITCVGFGSCTVLGYLQFGCIFWRGALMFNSLASALVSQIWCFPIGTWIGLMIVVHVFQVLFASITLDVQRMPFHLVTTAVLSCVGAYDTFVTRSSSEDAIPRKLTDGTKLDSVWPASIIVMASCLIGGMGIYGAMHMENYADFFWLRDWLMQRLGRLRDWLMRLFGRRRSASVQVESFHDMIPVVQPECIPPEPDGLLSKGDNSTEDTAGSSGTDQQHASYHSSETRDDGVEVNLPGAIPAQNIGPQCPLAHDNKLSFEDSPTKSHVTSADNDEELEMTSVAQFLLARDPVVPVSESEENASYPMKLWVQHAAQQTVLTVNGRLYCNHCCSLPPACPEGPKDGIWYIIADSIPASNKLVDWMHQLVIKERTCKLADGKIAKMQECNGQLKLGKLELNFVGSELHLEVLPGTTLRYMRKSGLRTVHTTVVSRPSQPILLSLKETASDKRLAIHTQTDDWTACVREYTLCGLACVFCDFSPFELEDVDSFWAPADDHKQVQDQFAPGHLLISRPWISTPCGKFLIIQDGQSLQVGSYFISCGQSTLHIGGLSWTRLPMTDLESYPDVKALSADCSMAPSAARIGGKLNGHWKVKPVYKKHVVKVFWQVNVMGHKLIDASGGVHKFGFKCNSMYGPGLKLHEGHWWCDEDLLHQIDANGMYVSWDRMLPHESD